MTTLPISINGKLIQNIDKEITNMGLKPGRNRPDDSEQQILFGMEISNIYKITGQDPLVTLECVDDTGRSCSLSIQIKNYAWIDVISTLPEYQTESGLKKLILVLKNVCGSTSIVSTSIISGIWLNFGPHETNWIRLWLSNDFAIKHVTEVIKESNNLFIGVFTNPAHVKTHNPRLKSLGIPIYQWFKIDYYKSPLPIEQLCIIENQYIPHTYNVGVYDIEVASGNVLEVSGIPLVDDNNNTINVIALQISSESRDPKHICITCFPIINIDTIEDVDIVIETKSEHDLLLIFWKLIKETEVRYLIDYNGLGFDQTWLLERSSAAKLDSEFEGHLEMHASLKKSAVPDPPAQSLLMVRSYIDSASTTADGGRGNITMMQARSLYTKGVTHLDMMYYILRTNQYSRKYGYSLDGMAAFLGKTRKIPISHWFVSIIYLSLESIKENNNKITEALTQRILNSIKNSLISRSILDTAEMEALFSGNVTDFIILAITLMRDYSYYCMVDALICSELAVQMNIIKTLQSQGRLYAQSVRDIAYRGVNRQSASYLEYQAYQLGYGYHNVPEDVQLTITNIENSIVKLGGITLEVIPQKIDDPQMIMAYDFHSAYPAGIIDMNISPETCSETKVKNAHRFDIPLSSGKGVRSFYSLIEPIGILPKIEMALITERAEKKILLKQAIQNNADLSVQRSMASEAQALKIMSVSVFGLTGSQFAVQSVIKYSVLANMIVLFSGFVLENMVCYMFVHYGLIPAIGVTDSAAFIMDYTWCDIAEVERTVENLYQIVKHISAEIENIINRFLDDLLGDSRVTDIGMEYVGMPLMCKKKKRYATRILDLSKSTLDEAHLHGKTKTVGYSPIRSGTANGIVSLAEIMEKIILDYNGCTAEIIIDKVTEFLSENVHNYDLWAKNERASLRNACMLTAMSNIKILSELGMGYSVPPTNGTRLNMIMVDYGFRCINVDGSVTNWSRGMVLLPLEDVKKLNLPIDKQHIIHMIMMLFKELLDDPQINIEIKKRLDSFIDKPALSLLSIKTRREYSKELSHMIGMDKCKYLTASILKAGGGFLEPFVSHLQPKTEAKLIKLMNVQTFDMALAKWTAKTSSWYWTITQLDIIMFVSLKVRYIIHLSAMCHNYNKAINDELLKKQIPILSKLVNSIESRLLGMAKAQNIDIL